MPTTLQAEPVMNLAEPSVAFEHATGLFPMASSAYTPSPYDGSSTIECTWTDPTSYNDNAATSNDDDTSFNEPKEVENEDQSNLGGPGPNNLDFSSLGSHLDGQICPQDHLHDDPSPSQLEGLRAIDELIANNLQ